MKGAWLVAAAALVLGASAPTPGGAPQPCASCHAEAARTWEVSAHHRSATDPRYEEAFALEPLAFCTACHAPAGGAERGIGCEDCHTNAGAHAADVKLAVATRSCASCHEFAFPNGAPGMQRTATEHAQSAFAKVACTGCHMTKHGANRDHAFAITDAMVREAVAVGIRQSGPAAVSVRLAPGRVGHAFPTGDLFRRVVVEASLVDETGTVQATQRRDLARTFGEQPTATGPTHVELADNRIAAPTSLDFDFAPIRAIAHPSVRVEIAYERVAHALGPRPDRAEVASGVVLADETVMLTPTTH